MQSFFSSSAKPARPALVSTVTVKKKVVPKPGSSSSGSRPGPLITKASSASMLSKPKAPSSSGSTHRPSPGLKPASSALSPRSPHSGSGSPAARRRKPTAPQRVLPESSDDESSDDALAPKRRRVNGTAASASTPDAAGEGDVGRSVFCPSRVDERGEWGRGYAGFVPCEHAVRGTVSGWAGGSKEGKEGEREKYQSYFPQEGFENAEPVPTVELRYPSGAKEKFVLLTPISAREYNPMSELRSALRFILKHYIPPSHAHIFGSLDATDDIGSSVPSRVHSPAPGSLTTPPPDGMSPLPPHTPRETIGDALRRALAPNRRDGPGLLKAVERLNSSLEEIASDGTMAAWLSSPQYRMSRRDWSEFVEFVHDQSYSRVVAPFSDQLEHHPKHPDEVAAAISEKEDAYGELRHNFMAKVMEQTDLGPDSVFVDLGSGVGNCVVQAALQAGSRSYGFELLPVPSRCARLQLRECQRRWAMWCLDGNTVAEVHEGDFRRHPSVVKSLRDADVVLVNNEVFPSSLNHELTDLFLELKEGATIVSLKPFVPDGFRLNDGNYNSFAAILRQTSHTYYSGWVSWKADSGKYYVQVVDRSIRARYDEEQNQRRRRD